MTKTIEVSDQTYLRLLKLVQSFDDRPEDVILRLIEGQGAASERPTGAGRHAAISRSETHTAPSRTERAAPGSILPEREYWRPILEVLVERGGSAPANDVIEEVGARLHGRLMDRDYDPLDIGETRWRNRTRFARLRMREQGLLSGSSHRGVWEITSRGRRYLEDDDADVS